ncbi:hypothetical protein J2X16_001976 [Pelomonas aquatica]|uniref:Heme exporter protein D n=1 Tax=Pelomonas aquatica TaxID=431058 RepID=A0ABU1Z7N7_9BURK|nr:hypothetical protein [Pelomonas aquatica]MDR7296629.1 hypothetical protein [Pelomonas aquatica]
MDTDLLTNPGFWLSISMVAMAWIFGTMLKRAGARREEARKPRQAMKTSS